MCAEGHSPIRAQPNWSLVAITFSSFILKCSDVSYLS
jgi:hypothetical protein